MEKKMIDTIVNLLSDLPDNKATSVMDYVKSLKHYTDSEITDNRAVLQFLRHVGPNYL